MKRSLCMCLVFWEGLTRESTGRTVLSVVMQFTGNQSANEEIERLRFPFTANSKRQIPVLRLP